MDIKLTDDYYLVSDKNCLSIVARAVSAKTGESYIKQTVGYYSTIPEALRSLRERLIRDSKATTLKQLNKDLIDINISLKEMATTYHLSTAQ